MSNSRPTKKIKITATVQCACGVAFNEEPLYRSVSEEDVIRCSSCLIPEFVDSTEGKALHCQFGNYPYLHELPSVKDEFNKYLRSHYVSIIENKSLETLFNVDVKQKGQELLVKLTEAFHGERYPILREFKVFAEPNLLATLVEEPAIAREAIHAIEHMATDRGNNALHKFCGFDAGVRSNHKELSTKVANAIVALVVILKHTIFFLGSSPGVTIVRSAHEYVDLAVNLITSEKLASFSQSLPADLLKIFQQMAMNNWQNGLEVEE